MKTIAIVPFTGSEELVEMTERCIVSLLDAGLEVVAMNNGASRGIASEVLLRDGVKELRYDRNLGFGRAVNDGIRYARDNGATHVLVANNDLEFPQPDWWEQLSKEAENGYVATPTTDVTAVPATRADGVVDLAPSRVPQASAFCWLVPMAVIHRIEQRYGFPLFDPAFFAYGEDDLTSAILRKQYGPKPFKVVHRSWVRHLKARTANEVGVRAGDPKNLKLLAQRKRTLGVR